MKIRFWGTRGSIPVSVTAPEVRRKLITALSGAAERNLRGTQAIERYVDEELGFDVRGTFGGHSSCVELETGGPEHVIFDMGSGARPLGTETAPESEPWWDRTTDPQLKRLLLYQLS